VFRNRLLLVFILLALALTALGVTVYFGVQAEEPVILVKRTAVAEGIASKPRLTVWAVCTVQGGDVLRDSIRRFEAELGQNIDLRMFSSRREYETARIVAAQERRLPDIFWVTADDIEALDQNDILQRIPLAEAAPDRWIPQVAAPFIRNNALLAYPAQYSVTVLFYNKTDFDGIGVAYPDTQWNWETLVGMGRALYRPQQGMKPARYGLEWTPTLDLWNAWSTQAGAPIYQGKGWFLGAPEAVAAQREALQFMVDLEQTYTFCAPPRSGSDPLFFVQGRASILIASSETRTLFPAEGLSWGVTQLPDRYALESTRSKRTTPLRITGWAISSKTANPDAARAMADKLSTVTVDGWLSAQRSAPLPEDGGDVFAAALATTSPVLVQPQGARIITICDNLLATLQTASTNVEKLEAAFKRGLEGIQFSMPPASAAPAPATAP